MRIKARPERLDDRQAACRHGVVSRVPGGFRCLRCLATLPDVALATARVFAGTHVLEVRRGGTGPRRFVLPVAVDDAEQPGRVCEMEVRELGRDLERLASRFAMDRCPHNRLHARPRRQAYGSLGRVRVYMEATCGCCQKEFRNIDRVGKLPPRCLELEFDSGRVYAVDMAASRVLDGGVARPMCGVMSAELA